MSWLGLEHVASVPELRPASKHQAVPSGCVFGHSPTGAAKVYVVRDNHVQATVVTLGDEDGTTTEVLSGLRPDDSLVLNPAMASRRAPRSSPTSLPPVISPTERQAPPHPTNFPLVEHIPGR
jgi:hypothetical protein